MSSGKPPPDAGGAPISRGRRAHTLDPDIGRLLEEEIKKHTPSLDPGAPPSALRRAVHALKGSAGAAGARGLADAFARIERRLLAGDPAAADEARRAVSRTADALAAGEAIDGPSWPEPPPDLRAVAIDPSVEAHYRAEMQDRLSRLDATLATSGDDVAAALSAFRDVHAMKGAAHTVSDEVTAWFCHGLEDSLRARQGTEEDARAALAELTRWRGLLAEVVVSPDRALETLRVLARPSQAQASVERSLLQGAPLPLSAPMGEPQPPESPPRDTPPVPRSSGAPESESRPPMPEDTTLRVPTATLERLLDRVQLLSLSRGDVLDGASTAAELADRTRVLRGDLAEALRLIGPPRPWGAPAAAIQRIERASREMAGLADRLDWASAAMKETAENVRVQSAGAHRDLGAMRTVRVGWLFERVAAAVGAEARREARAVRLVFSGEDTAIDRRLAEQLFDSVLQLARNAVAHGIETAPERAMRGKPRQGTVQLRAEERHDGLRFVVQDDGAGVDVADVRRRAVARGTISAETASQANDQTLLSVLFVPGFTTRDSADLLAGRGVGLDLVLDAVHRLGGTIRLTSTPGMGLTATLDIPFEPGLLRVLWLEAESETFALPIRRSRRILRGRGPEAAGAVPLYACLRREALDKRRFAPAYGVEIEPARGELRPPVIGVDGVGAVEEVALRPVSPLVAAAGPYAGVVVRGAELRLCLDAHGLAEAASAIAHRGE